MRRLTLLSDSFGRLVFLGIAGLFFAARSPLYRVTIVLQSFLVTVTAFVAFLF
jgi:hypothetical protein